MTNPTPAKVREPDKLRDADNLDVTVNDLRGNSVPTSDLDRPAIIGLAAPNQPVARRGTAPIPRVIKLT